MNNATTGSLGLDRLLPHDKDAERAVLGIVLTAGKIPPDAQEIRPADFYAHRHAQYWAAMLRLNAEGQPIDIIAVKSLLQVRKNEDPPERIAADLGSLLDDRWTSANLGFYVDIIRKKAALRTIIETSVDIIDLAQSEPTDFQDLVAAAEKQVAVLHGKCAELESWGFPFRTWDLSAAAIQEAQEIIWTVEPLMAAPDVLSLVGDGGVGKSKTAAAIALSVAFGKPCLGHFDVRKFGRVAYLNEERPDLTRRHLHTLAPSLGIDPDKIQDRIVLLGRGELTWRVTDVQAQRALIRRICELGDVVLLVFDSLHVLHDREENDNAQMTQVIEAFRQICEEIGCCGLILHHTGKGAPAEIGGSARGASAIKDSVDSQFMVRRAKEDVLEELRIHQDKTRRALVAPFLLRLEHDPQGDLLSVAWVGKAPSKTDLALEAVVEIISNSAETLKSGEIALKLAGKFRKETVYDALKQVRKDKLAPWREGERQGFLYGGKKDEGPQE